MKILALDIANKTGYAHNCAALELLRAGTIELGTKEEIAEWGRKRMTRRCDDRVCRLMKLISTCRPDTIVFEDVQFVYTQVQGQLWASLRTAVWAYACSNKVLVECVPVQTLKLYATGKGGAGKAQMCRALAQEDSRFFSEGERVFDKETKTWLDDNAVDAIWLWKWGQQYLA